ncbi:hypothetical protein CJ231_10715 [Hoylesella buccalis]|uniref:Uncharacterized protein n=1 Tax=Hoylesella buccalis TaxID=28127 RepID=A0A2N6QNQ6_9BACT|nr:hypothetical protein CJ231_10715 [Hoylesella buccalis]
MVIVSMTWARKLRLSTLWQIADLICGGATRKEDCSYKSVKIEEETIIMVIICIFVVKSFLFLSFND